MSCSLSLYFLSVSCFLCSSHISSENGTSCCLLVCFRVYRFLFIFSKWKVFKWTFFKGSFSMSLLYFLSSLCDESFVFLLKQKRYNDIREILQKIARTNKTEIDQTIWESFIIEPCENSERVVKNKATKAIQPHLLLNAIIVLNW